MNKWKEFYEYYKENPIRHYEEYLGIKLTKFQKIRLKVYVIFIKYLEELIYEQNKIIQEILIEPHGTTKYEILKLHLAILGLRINLIKEVFRIKGEVKN